MEDICNFIPPQERESNLEFIHFVYETNIKRHQQPFVRSYFHMNIVFKGTAVLKIADREFKLESGDVFFTFPDQSYFIDADNSFTFLYISFTGNGALPLLNSLNINKENCVYNNLSNTLQFWMDAIKRINRTNANVLTESVLMYTLSFINNNDDKNQFNDKFDSIIEYINHNYTLQDISIGKIADIFFYTEKYLSSLFVRKTGVKFRHYLNNLRIQYAIKLIEEKNTDITDICFKCGYTDRFYFSKVFKKFTGKSPSQYIKENTL